MSGMELGLCWIGLTYSFMVCLFLLRGRGGGPKESKGLLSGSSMKARVMDS